ncbi:MAG: hypothetical protein N2109_12145 [Fimbriimonadales bacterium]|nr:hypothetical protein [Fimbriimonadales bacterium]
MTPWPIALDACRAFATALLVSAVLAPAIFRILVALRARQEISRFAPEGHQKKQGTPTMGGLIVLGGLAAALAVRGEAFVPLGLLIGFGLIGFLDDFVVPRLWRGKRGLGWIPKLALQVAASLAPLTVGGHLGKGAAWVAGFVFVVLFCANAYNFADGLDALAGGLLLAMAPTFVLLGLLWQEPLVPGVFGALAGAILPFLLLNAPPARVFLGDVGSLPIGALIGWAVFRLGASGPIDGWRWLSLGLLGFVLIAELVPVPIQIASVKLTGRRVFPRTPIHHAFEHRGWPETRVCWMFLLAQTACSGLAALAALWRWKG